MTQYSCNTTLNHILLVTVTFSNFLCALYEIQSEIYIKISQKSNIILYVYLQKVKPA